jgi:exosortase/archaeosortase family protein
MMSFPRLSTKFGRAHFRFFAWIAAASGVSFLVAPNFTVLLSQDVGDAFGSVLPVIPFAALLAVLFVLRWSDLRDVLAKEGGLSSEVPVRLLGVAILATLLLLESLTARSVYSSATAVILTFYGTSLVINPLTRRIMLPYAATYSIGVTAPAVLQWALGEPLAELSSSFSAGLIALIGIPVTWHGTQFALVSKTGELVAAVVTPGCSSIISVTTFLGLLGLMHMDLKKDISSTLKIAAVGVAVLTVLNSLRITFLVWVGYVNGANALWGLHNWVGYALFLGFYLAILVVYPRMGRQATFGNARTGIR